MYGFPDFLLSFDTSVKPAFIATYPKFRETAHGLFYPPWVEDFKNVSTFPLCAAVRLNIRCIQWQQKWHIQVLFWLRLYLELCWRGRQRSWCLQRCEPGMPLPSGPRPYSDRQRPWARLHYKTCNKYKFTSCRHHLKHMSCRFAWCWKEHSTSLQSRECAGYFFQFQFSLKCCDSCLQK